MSAVHLRYVAAVELLGERDEALEELRADLQDVKNLYRDQIEYLVKQLTTPPGSLITAGADAVGAGNVTDGSLSTADSGRPYAAPA